MFLPYFIALFLGLVSPSENSNYHSNTDLVSTTSNGEPEDGDPTDDDGSGTGGGSTGGGTGGTGGGSTGGAGGGSTGGETGTIPPPNP